MLLDYIFKHADVSVFRFISKEDKRKMKFLVLILALAPLVTRGQAPQGENVGEHLFGGRMGGGRRGPSGGGLGTLNWWQPGGGRLDGGRGNRPGGRGGGGGGGGGGFGGGGRFGGGGDGGFGGGGRGGGGGGYGGRGGGRGGGGGGYGGRGGGGGGPGGSHWNWWENNEWEPVEWNYPEDSHGENWWDNFWSPHDWNNWNDQGDTWDIWRPHGGFRPKPTRPPPPPRPITIPSRPVTVTYGPIRTTTRPTVTTPRPTTTTSRPTTTATTSRPTTNTPVTEPTPPTLQQYNGYVYVISECQVYWATQSDASSTPVIVQPQTDEEGNLFIQGGENPVIPVDQDRFPLSGDIARPSGCGNAVQPGQPNQK